MYILTWRLHLFSLLDIMVVMHKVHLALKQRKVCVIFLIALASLKKNYKQNTITVQRCIYKVQASYTASTTVLNPIVQIKTHVTRYED